MMSEDPSNNKMAQSLATVTESAAADVSTEHPPTETPFTEPLSRECPSKESSHAPPLSPPFSHFSSWAKFMIVAIATLAQFSSTLTISIYFPAVPQIATDLHTSTSEVNLTITTYMIFQGVVPLLTGSFSDSYGRRPAYIVCLAVYFASNVALANQTTIAGLLALRCLQSAGCSGTTILASAVIGDIIPSSERGKYISITGIPAILGPSLSPVLGGVLTQYLGWRSIFWVLAGFAGLQFVVISIFLPETCRNLVHGGTHTAPRWNTSILELYQRSRKTKNKAASEQLTEKPQGVYRPYRVANILGTFDVLRSPPSLLPVMFGGVYYAATYAVVSTISTQFDQVYHFSSVQQGLVFLPYGLGGLAAVSIGKFAMDRNYRRLGTKLERSSGGAQSVEEAEARHFPYERARLQIGVPIFVVGAAVMLAYGWLQNYNGPIAAICVVLFFLGLASAIGLNLISVLLVDTHPGRTATAAAALNLVKCPLGAGAVAVVVPMINRIGPGWTFTIWAGSVATTIPLLLVAMIYGVKWRTRGS